MKKYDIIIVGAGLTGAMIAYKNRDRKILVLEKKSEIGGFCHTFQWEGVNIHKYGTHVFHTDKKEVWDFVNSVAPFIPCQLNVKATNNGKIYSLPFNMNTWYQLWGCTDIEDAKQKVKDNWGEVVDILIKGYSEKQWGRELKDIPEEIIKRIPVRFTWNNNYHFDKYVGIPECGYTEFIAKLFGDADILFNTDYLKDKSKWEGLADEIYYTGAIDEYYDYCYGKLDWRCLRHEHDILEIDNYQGCPQMNYTDKDVPYTRIIEHKHFMPWIETDKTWISREYSVTEGEVAYPINDDSNNALYKKYASIPSSVKFCGRLGEYKYYNMDEIIEKYI